MSSRRYFHAGRTTRTQFINVVIFISTTTVVHNVFINYKAYYTTLSNSQIYSVLLPIIYYNLWYRRRSNAQIQLIINWITITRDVIGQVENFRGNRGSYRREFRSFSALLGSVLCMTYYLHEQHKMFRNVLFTRC